LILEFVKGKNSKENQMEFIDSLRVCDYLILENFSNKKIIIPIRSIIM